MMNICENRAQTDAPADKRTGQQVLSVAKY